MTMGKLQETPNGKKHDGMSSVEISFVSGTADEGGWIKLENPEDRNPQKEKDNKQLLGAIIKSALTTQNLIVLAGSGTSLAADGPSMEHLWEKARKLDHFEEVVRIARYDTSQHWIEDLLSRCHTAKSFFADDPDNDSDNGTEADRDKEDDPSNYEMLDSFLRAAKQMIKTECTEFLKGPDKLEAHRTFLRRMARRRTRAPRLRLFTTNYDTCFERAAGQIALTVIDGFSFTYPRFFDPRFLSYDVVRRAHGSDESYEFVEGVVQLLKLHGSVTWKQKDGRIQQSDKPSDPLIIIPTIAKYEQTYSQPYLEFMSIFQQALREPNTCLVVVGFGFGDNHLNAHISAALESNPSFKLLVVDPNIRTHSADESEAHSFVSGLSTLINHGQDVTFINATFEQFSEVIPDLRALTKAEQLERVVGQVMNKP